MRCQWKPDATNSLNRASGIDNRSVTEPIYKPNTIIKSTKLSIKRSIDKGQKGSLELLIDQDTERKAMNGDYNSFYVKLVYTEPATQIEVDISNNRTIGIDDISHRKLLFVLPLCKN